MKNLWTKLSAKTNAKSVEKTSSKGVKAYYAGVSAAAMALVVTMTTQVSAISDIADSVKSLFSDIYGAVITVATVIAIALISVCLVLRMISKNPRTAEEATSWIKRIAITWLCLMLLSLFLNYGLEIVTNTGANTENPWE